jgi:hypothetical protein
MQRELISKALRERFNELCGVRLSKFAPEEFGELASFVSHAQEQLHKALPADGQNSSPGMSAPDGWMESDADCLTSLRALGLGQPLQLRPGRSSSVDSFLKALDECRDHPERRFQLLSERYRCPLNFALPGEREVREHVLMRLMVQDRARLEKTGVAASLSDDLLLRLNLVAVQARLVPDLRFLDSLNYYYELLPATWQPQGQHDWLLVSYLALYARALAAWI